MRKVFHIMRTYGAHGGERQLEQMFAQPAPSVAEQFVFLYRDTECERLFRQRTQLLVHRLCAFAVRPRGAWAEMALLMLTLPWMQLRLLWLIARHRPEVCVVHGFQASLAAWPAAMLLHKRIGFAYFHRTTKSSAGRNPLFRLIYAPYRKLLGVSYAVKDSLAGLTPVSKLGVIENGVDTAPITQAQTGATRAEPPVIIAVGRLLSDKGQRLIIEAFASITTAQLWIVGDGEDHAHLTAMIGERSTIRLLGRRDDIPTLLAQATIFCHASPREGMSNAVLEAMAASLPSVVADAPGVSECHVDAITGFVVPRNAAAIAEKIALLLQDEALRKRMGDAAFVRVREQYSIAANRQKFLALYEELAGAPCAA